MSSLYNYNDFKNLAMDVNAPYEEVTLPGVITSTMLSIAGEFAIAYNFYDGGYPPIEFVQKTHI